MTSPKDLSKDFPKNLRTPWKDLLRAAKLLLIEEGFHDYNGYRRRDLLSELKQIIKACEAMAELEKTALKVKRDRDALLEAAKMIMNAPGIEIEYGGPSWDALEAAIKQAERP